MATAMEEEDTTRNAQALYVSQTQTLGEVIHPQSVQNIFGQQRSGNKINNKRARGETVVFDHNCVSL